MDLHVAYHVAEGLAIIYLIISVHQTKQMLIHLARTILSVNDHLDTLIKISAAETKKFEENEERELNHNK